MCAAEVGYLNRDFSIIAHRGASAYLPENTLASIQLAVDLDVDAIEIDVHCCEDDLVVIHDTTLDRTTNGHGLVATSKLSALRQLDAGQHERVPLLSEVLDLLPPSVGLNIELKGRGTGRALAHRLAKYELTVQPLVVSSFAKQELHEFHRRMPEVPVAVLARAAAPQALATAWELRAAALHLADRAASKESLGLIRERGLPVYVYTVNELDRAAELANWGAAGIFTDRPREVAHKYLTVN